MVDAGTAFSRSQWRRRRARATEWLLRRRGAGRLATLEQDLGAVPARRRSAGLRAVPLDSIVGTAESAKARSFDASFRPAPSSRRRWEGLWLATRRGRQLPPISRLPAGRLPLRRRRPPPCVGGTCPRHGRDRRGGHGAGRHLPVIILAMAPVRSAEKPDCEAIAGIYNEAIAEGRSTFETEPRSAADVEGWLDSSLLRRHDGRRRGGLGAAHALQPARLLRRHRRGQRLRARGPSADAVSAGRSRRRSPRRPSVPACTRSSASCSPTTRRAGGSSPGTASARWASTSGTARSTATGATSSWSSGCSASASSTARWAARSARTVPGSGRRPRPRSSRP